MGDLRRADRDFVSFVSEKQNAKLMKHRRIVEGTRRAATNCFTNVIDFAAMAVNPAKRQCASLTDCRGPIALQGIRRFPPLVQVLSRQVTKIRS
jgi:hypothetical protein